MSDHASPDTPTKMWSSFTGMLPNCMWTDDYGLYKLAWEAKGFKVIKGP